MVILLDRRNSYAYSCRMVQPAVMAYDALVEFVAGFSTQKDAARALGVTPAHLTDMLKRRRSITPTTLDRMGYETRITIERKRTA